MNSTHTSRTPSPTLVESMTALAISPTAAASPPAAAPAVASEVTTAVPQPSAGPGLSPELGARSVRIRGTEPRAVRPGLFKENHAAFDLGPCPAHPEKSRVLEAHAFDGRAAFLGPQGDGQGEFDRLAAQAAPPTIVDARRADSKAVALASARLQPLVEKFMAVPVSRNRAYLNALLALREALCERGWPDWATRVALFRSIGLAGIAPGRHLEHILNALLFARPDAGQIAMLLVDMTEAGVAEHACRVLMVDCWRHMVGKLEPLPEVARLARQTMVELHGAGAFVPTLMQSLEEHFSDKRSLDELVPVVRAMNVRGVVPAERNAYYAGVSRGEHGFLHIHGKPLTRCGPEMVPVLAGLIDHCYELGLDSRGKVLGEVNKWALICKSVLGHDLAREVRSRLTNQEALADLEIEIAKAQISSILADLVRK